MSINRRNLLLTVGGVALLGLGADATLRGWRAVANRQPPSVDVGERHRSVLAALADTILPATSTPGALDVGVTVWIEHLLADSFTPTDRMRVLTGLDLIDAHAMDQFGKGIAALVQAQRSALVEGLDRSPRFGEIGERVRAVVEHRLPSGGPLQRYVESVGAERRALAETKALIVHGYFTSEIVQRELMKVTWA